jgi:hypothetical protein
MIEKFFKVAIENSGLFFGVEVHPIIMPQKYNYPAIVFNRISSNDDGSKDAKTGHIRPERWSFGCYAKTIKAVRDLEDNLKILFDQVKNDSYFIQLIYLADVSSDFYDEELELFSVNVDFYVKRIIQANGSSEGDPSTIVNSLTKVYKAELSQGGNNAPVLKTEFENTLSGTGNISFVYEGNGIYDIVKTNGFNGDVVGTAYGIPVMGFQIDVFNVYRVNDDTVQFRNYVTADDYSKIVLDIEVYT